MLKVKQLLNDIRSFDCEPAVFEVSLQAPSYLDCFVVNVVFRNPKGQDPSAHSVTVRDDDPEKALEIALGILQQRFSKCPTCEQYRHPNHHISI